MIDFKILLFLILIIIALYLMGPIAIFFVGIIALLSSFSSSSLLAITPNYNSIPLTDQGLGTTVYDPRFTGFTSDFQRGGCGGCGGRDGLDMTADEVYAAFAAHPYPGKDLGYGYYDGYDYVI